MRVRFILAAALLNPQTKRYRKLLVGRTYDLPADVAGRFVARGAAVPASEPQDDSSPEE